MQITNLSLINFKNYAEAKVEFHSKLNCLIGDNGVGKTNLLDAIYYMCMCKSYFSATDLFSIRKGFEFMVLQADFVRNEKKEEIYCGLKKNKKKQFRRNKKEYSRLSDHIGLFPVVMVSPSDIQLILDGSEERRKYLNSVISQYNKNYLYDTIGYHKILSQRNRLLKDHHSNNSRMELLEVFDDQLVKLGNAVHNERVQFVEKFIPVFNDLYHRISGGAEDVELKYESQLSQGNFADQLKNCREKDFALQYTTCGIHKDDLTLDLNGASIRKTGSQGQQKTFLVSLKFAQFKFLTTVKKVLPLLLLDDVFDKFDSKRVKQILELVTSDSFGQIFITHTNLDRMNSILNELNLDHKIFMVEKGKIDELKLS